MGTCPSCTAALPAAARFCEQCGLRLSEPVAPRPAAAKAAPPAKLARHSMLQRARQRSADSDASAIGKARMSMVVIAILLFLSTGMGWFGLEGEVSKVSSQGMRVNGDVVAQLRALLFANGALGVGFLALAAWSSRNAFAAVLTGLVLYIALILASAAVSPITLVQGIIIKILIVGFLIGGLRAALKQRRRQADAGA